MTDSVEPVSSAQPPRRRREDSRLGSRPAQVALLAFIAVLLVVFIWLLLRWAREPAPHAVEGAGLESVLIVKGPGEGDLPGFDRPLAAAYGPANDIYVSDTGHGRICVFSEKGRFRREFGRTVTDTPVAQRKDNLSQPAGLDVTKDGTVFVADLRRGAIMVYSPRGRLIRSFHPPTNKKRASAWSPTDVAVSGDTVAVTDAAGVKLFSVDGQLKASITKVKPGSDFMRPNGVVFAADGTLVVSDTNNARVVALDPDGTVLWVFDAAKAGSAVLGLPRGICIMSDGSAMVADAFRFSLVRISADGELIRSYGSRGTMPAAFEFPNDVDVIRDLALVADKENARIQVVRLMDPNEPAAAK
ncbi:MAG: hypothetical protein CVT67_08560 [Actinobacteria bacterium HGW-Actinobacteria-7]|nr:MAG: hypothetical protein CVT67_08560 [Actinobacteria bacterium HGW-Actinobacteria-7]